MTKIWRVQDAKARFSELLATSPCRRTASSDQAGRGGSRARSH